MTKPSPYGRIRQVQKMTSCHNFDTINWAHDGEAHRADAAAHHQVRFKRGWKFFIIKMGGGLTGGGSPPHGLGTTVMARGSCGANAPLPLSAQPGLN